MRLNITVHADNLSEVRAALDHVADGLPRDLFDRRRAFIVNVAPDDDGSYETDPSPLRAEPAPPATPPPSRSAAKKRGRGPKAAPAAVTLATDVLAIDALDSAETELEVDTEADVDADPLGLNAPAEDPPLTPAQAKIEALERLRRLFAAPGGAEITKRVLTKFGAVRFAEVPEERGHELLREALSAEAEHAAR